MSKYAFYLMTKKGYKVLKALVENGYSASIGIIIGAQDKNIQKDYFGEIVALCQSNNIPFSEKKIASPLNVDYSFAVSWRWMLPPSKLIVLHDSLLPKYRGFAPLVSALINGEKQIGVTALLAEERFDTGAILAQKAVHIDYPIKIDKAIDLISDFYQDLVLEIIKSLDNGERLEAVPQNHYDATYSLWRDEEDYKINWSWSSEKIERFVNAVGHPYKGAFTTLDEQKLRIHEVSIIPDLAIENRDTGKIIWIEQNHPIIVCGTGLLKIKEMSWENGSTALPLKNFRVRLR